MIANKVVMCLHHILGKNIDLGSEYRLVLTLLIILGVSASICFKREVI